MAHWFEDLTKTLGDDKIGRRTAIRRMAGTLAGTAFASAIPGIAEARINKHCPSGGNCSSFINNCLHERNTNCYCFTELGGRPVCACNSLCSQSQTCSSSMKCPNGYVCIVSNGCNCSSSQGVCVHACKGKNKNCKLGSGHGKTAAGRN
jgi:hypothetical protein